jgi:hypothetical protein
MQIEYLRECKFICSMFIRTEVELSHLDYRMNNNPQNTVLEQIAKQWNTDYFSLFLNLSVSIFFTIHISYCLFPAMFFLWTSC